MPLARNPTNQKSFTAKFNLTPLFPLFFCPLKAKSCLSILEYIHCHFAPIKSTNTFDFQKFQIYRDNNNNNNNNNNKCLLAMVGFQAFFNAVVAFLVITRARAADKSKMVTRVTDDGLLCISECATCPALCSPPSPPPSSSKPSPPLSSTPPPPSLIYVGHHPPPPPGSPPKTTKSAPPPPFNYLIITSAPPPPSGGQKGAPSNPYYYFYTSNAWTSALSISCVLKLFSWVVLSLFLFIQ